MKYHIFVFLAFFLIFSSAAARADEPNLTAKPYYVGTSLFVLMNLAPSSQPPAFYQLNIGYQLTPKDRLSIEAITWRYYHPLGIPWGDSPESASNAYPGHVQKYGVGLVLPKVVMEGHLHFDQRRALLASVLRPAGHEDGGWLSAVPHGPQRTPLARHGPDIP